MTAAADERPEDVLRFWREAGPAAWFRRDDAFDAEIRRRFAALHRRAAEGGLDAWAAAPEGALALIIVLDQFSRNLGRFTAQAFAADGRALAAARQAVDAGFDRRTEPALRKFFYMPFMHSERLADQDRCVLLCHALHDPGTLPYAREHRRIIRRFGRFPHRNAVLGRHTTPAEAAFLAGGGFAG